MKPRKSGEELKEILDSNTAINIALVQVRAGVSQSTIYKVLRDDPNETIRPKVRKRVEDTILALDGESRAAG